MPRLILAIKRGTRKTRPRTTRLYAALLDGS
jgi:hypothetical protein